MSDPQITPDDAPAPAVQGEWLRWYEYIAVCTRHPEHVRVTTRGIDKPAPCGCYCDLCWHRHGRRSGSLAWRRVTMGELRHAV